MTAPFSGEASTVGGRVGSAHRSVPPLGIRASPDAVDVLRYDDPGMERTMLIVDDHEGFRRQARALFARAGYEVVGEAADVASAVRSAVELKPAVVLLDVQLPDGDGFEAAERILAAEKPPAVVLISSRDAPDYGARIQASGVDGFISKADLSVRALEAVLGGAP
jgi:DNA-binding NarL/FixJ family response regulator